MPDTSSTKHTTPFNIHEYVATFFLTDSMLDYFYIVWADIASRRPVHVPVQQGRALPAGNHRGGSAGDQSRGRHQRTDADTRRKHSLTQSPDKWSEKQKERMELLFEMYPKIKEAYWIVNGLRSIFRSKTLDKEPARLKLHEWYKTVSKCTSREIKSARDAIKSREDEVLNYFINRSTNAGAESLLRRHQQVVLPRCGLRQ